MSAFGQIAIASFQQIVCAKPAEGCMDNLAINEMPYYEVVYRHTHTHISTHPLHSHTWRDDRPHGSQGVNGLHRRRVESRGVDYDQRPILQLYKGRRVVQVAVTFGAERRANVPKFSWDDCNSFKKDIVRINYGARTKKEERNWKEMVGESESARRTPT